MRGTTSSQSMGEIPTRAVDIVFVVDISLGHDSFLDSFRKNLPDFLSHIHDKLASTESMFSILRVKITWFRDFYFDGNEAYGESPFYYYPNEKGKIHSFASALKCSGGGDLPESSLEALTLAMRSDFSQAGDFRNHFVILVTDEDAHRFEDYTRLAKIALRQGRVPIQYPDHMPWDAGAFSDAWVNNDPNGFFSADSEHTKLDPMGKWLFFITPDCYPWDDMEVCLDRAARIPVKMHGGCGDVDWEELEHYLSFTLDYYLETNSTPDY